PIELWVPQDSGFVDVVQHLRRVIAEIKTSVAKQREQRPADATPAPRQRVGSISKRNSDFVGRERELQRLETLLVNRASPAVAAIVGPGGGGQSAPAVRDA